MKARSARIRALVWALAAAIPIAGCGLKGALTLPEKSTNVVIRPSPGGATAPPTATATPSATPPATEPIPPPELPPDSRGNTRG